MYKPMIEIMKQYVKASGKIEFKAAVAFRESEVFSGKVPYRAFYYAYNENSDSELLARFALTVRGGLEYNISNLSFVKEDCKPALRDLLLELIIEKSIEEAKSYKTSYLIIETKDPKIVEATMDFNFKVMLNEETHLYRCMKKFVPNYSVKTF